uniref:Uncharacterized protein n=1 Tax=Spongospora subterranea TaxID=70186 RepID=A0A0H5R9L3_9EUKA|eukprot:CRZ10372.1 hypothetical protein [Spongospora subterranea]
MGDRCCPVVQYLITNSIHWGITVSVLVVFYQGDLEHINSQSRLLLLLSHAVCRAPVIVFESGFRLTMSHFSKDASCSHSFTNPPKTNLNLSSALSQLDTQATKRKRKAKNVTSYQCPVKSDHDHDEEMSDKVNEDS